MTYEVVAPEDGKVPHRLLGSPEGQRVDMLWRLCLAVGWPVDKVGPWYADGLELEGCLGVEDGVPVVEALDGRCVAALAYQLADNKGKGRVSWRLAVCVLTYVA